MRFRNNILLLYTISTFTIILVFSLILGGVLAKWTEDLQIQKHIDLYPQITKQVLESDPEVVQTLATKNYSNAAQQMKGVADHILAFGSVFRVKIWGDNSTVLWSDDNAIIGKQFPDNTEYHEAWAGRLVYDVSKPDKTEQVSESSHTQILEIYSPVRYQGKVVAIFEMYEATDVLFAEIQSNIQFIWWAVGAFGLTIYILLFIIFYRAHKMQTHLYQSLQKTQEVTIMSLAAVAETRDKETGKHILRTRKYVELLAHELKTHPRFKSALTHDDIDLLVKSSPLHDIGKVGVPDHILLKPGKLTPEEFEEIKKHTIYGKDALSVAETQLGTTSFLETAREIAFTHHEKWDGSGYPQGLRGDSIPVSGRLMALADVYDALISKRIYKEAFPHESAAAILKEGSGHHFDPDVVNAFLTLEQKFIMIAKELAD